MAPTPIRIQPAWPAFGRWYLGTLGGWIRPVYKAEHRVGEAGIDVGIQINLAERWKGSGSGSGQGGKRRGF